MDYDILSSQHNTRKEVEGMTQNSSDMKRLAELNSLFLTLNSKDQDIALIILRSLKFSQSVMSSPDPAEHTRKPPKNRFT